MKKFSVAFLSLVCTFACAFGLVACGDGSGSGKPHEHVFSSQWSHNATHHWHAATCEHTDEVKDKAEHDFANGECVCGYKLPDKTAALISFFEKNFADKVFGDKTVYAQTAYADEENEALKGISVVYTYETTELDRAVELAQLSFEPIAVADIISGSAAVPQTEISRTTVFEFDAKDNYDRQDVADAVYAVYKKTSDIKLFNQSESGQRDLTRLQILEEKDNKYTIYQMDVLEAETDEALIFNIHTPEVVFNKKTVSSTTIAGTIFYEKNYEYEKLEQVKIRYSAIKENNETVGFKLSEIYDKTVTSLEIPAEYYGKPVTELAEHAFDGCDALQSITVDENNSAFASADGILYNKEKTQILAVPQAITGKVTLADGVTELAANAFANRTALTQIVLPSGLQTIGDSAFSGCPLTEIVLTSGLQTIGDSAFKGCSFTEVSLPESVTQAYGVFTDCNALEKLSLPACGNILGYYFGANNYSQQKDYIPDSLKTVIIRGGDKVKDYAFYECGSLESVIIPDSVTTIGSSAFYNCLIEKATIPSFVCGYINNSALKSVVITSGTSIEDRALQYCKNLTSITIPQSVTTIGAKAFNGCSGLDNIVLPDSITSIGENAFYDCPIETATIPSIAISAIPKTALTSIRITYGTEIPENAFKDSVLLESVYLPDNLKTIGNYAFSGCTALYCISVWDNPVQGVELPNSLTSIGNCAFMDCIKLDNITISDNLQSIGFFAFSGCSSLTSIAIPDSVTSIAHSAFYNCTNMISVKLSQNIATISEKMFYGCTSLLTVNIPENVTLIDEYAFYQCKKLKSVVINQGVTRIAIAAFLRCEGLQDITIPKSMESIAASSLRECSSLKNINYSGTKSEWANISKGRDWNMLTGNYTIHCTDGDIAKSEDN